MQSRHCNASLATVVKYGWSQKINARYYSTHTVKKCNEPTQQIIDADLSKTMPNALNEITQNNEYGCKKYVNLLLCPCGQIVRILVFH